MNQFYQHKRVLVTGADGFIGSALVIRLVEAGAVVYGVVHSKKHLWRLEPVTSAISLLEGDLSVLEDTERVFEESHPDIVFNVASSLNTARSFDSLEKILANTYGITHNVVTTALQKGVRQCIHFGSIDEYGMGESPLKESDREEPLSPYSLGKIMGTQLVLLVGRTTDCRVTVVRPAATYGPGQNPGMLIPNIIKAGMEGANFNMNPGEQLRDLIYIDDLVEGVLRIGVDARADGQILNLGSGRGTQVKEVATLVNEAMGSPIQIHFGTEPYRPLDPMIFYMSNAKAKKLLDWEPKVTLAEGIAKTVAWYRQYRERGELVVK